MCCGEWESFGMVLRRTGEADDYGNETAWFRKQSLFPGSLSPVCTLQKRHTKEPELKDARGSFSKTFITF